MDEAHYDLYRTYNDPGEGSNFINGTGAVDIYGLVSVDEKPFASCSRVR